MKSRFLIVLIALVAYSVTGCNKLEDLYSNSAEKPVAVDSSIQTNEDTRVSDKLEGRTVADSVLTFELGSLVPQRGRVVLLDKAQGTYTYIPNGNVSGADQFSFYAVEEGRRSKQGRVTVMITPVNDSPVVSVKSFRVDNTQTLNGTISATDVEADALRYRIERQPAHGSVSIPDPAVGAFRYVPQSGYVGADSFQVVAADASAASAPATFSITVEGMCQGSGCTQNRPPVAMPSTISTMQETAKNGTVTGSDPDGNPLTFQIVSMPTRGSLTNFSASSGNFTYTPNTGVTGSDSFTFKANDGTLDSAAATVSIQIDARPPTNRAPVAMADTLSAVVGTALSVSLRATDADNDPLQFTIVTQPTKGTVSGFSATTGHLTYTPTAAGSDSIVFRASDSRLDSNSATVTLNNSSSPPNGPTFKIAFIGDHDVTDGAKKVMKLVKDEGAELLTIAGDLDYKNDPALWEKFLNENLGTNFPVIAVTGNHDDGVWGGPTGYAAKQVARLARTPQVTCRIEGGPDNMGVKSICNYKGLDILLSGANQLGSGHIQFIDAQLTSSASPIKICVWHSQMKKLQTGGKSDETGYEIFEACQKFGALVVNGHEHSYGRTHLLSNVRTQTIASTADPIELKPNTLVVLLNGAGGRSLDAVGTTGRNSYWASISTTNYTKAYPPGSLYPSSGTHGASICEVSIQKKFARCYYKDINNQVLDRFTLLAPGGTLP